MNAMTWIGWMLACLLLQMQPHAAAAAPASQEPDGPALYHNYCSVCHGDKGDGKSRAAGSLSTLPRDFTSAESRRALSREAIVTAITQGRPGTAMVSWRTQLSERDIARLADYVHEHFVLGQAAVQSAAISGHAAHGGREADAAPVPVPAFAPAVASAAADMSLGLPNGLQGNLKRGGSFYLANCATCHGTRGDGTGPRAYFINPKPLNFLDAASRARLNRVALFAAVSEGKLGTEMPAWSKVSPPQQIADVAEYVFQTFLLGKAAPAQGARR